MLHRPGSTLVPEAMMPMARSEGMATKAHRSGALQAAQDHFKPCNRVVDPQHDTPVSLGTTILAVKFDGGVVLAADSRTSTGTYVVNRVSNKLTKLTDRIYCCRSGSAADTQFLAELTSRYVNSYALEEGDRPPLVASAASLFQKLCYMNRWGISAGIIVAGWDPVNGGSVFNIPLGGASIQHNYALGGSGSVFLYGWMDANYKAGMTKEQCIEFVKTAVSHAISRDGSSGGVVRTMALSKDGAEHTTTPWSRIPYTMEKDPEFGPLCPQNTARRATAKTGKNVTDSTKEDEA